MRKEIITNPNGKGTVTYTWLIDDSNPKMWIEGHEYKFNSQLISVEYCDPIH